LSGVLLFVERGIAAYYHIIDDERVCNCGVELRGADVASQLFIENEPHFTMNIFTRNSPTKIRRREVVMTFEGMMSICNEAEE